MPSSTDAVYDGYGREATDAFHATLLWEKIVIHLERTVRCARRSQGLKSYNDCFQGSKAVDVLMDYLNAILPSKTVKRAQIRTLCQQLLNTGVFEDVRSKDKCVFRENRLYKFTGSHFWEPTHVQQVYIPRSRSVEHIAHGDKITPSPKLRSSCRLRLEKGYTSDSTITASSHKHRERQRAVLLQQTQRPSTTKTRERLTSVFQCTRPNPEPSKSKVKAPSPPPAKPSKKEKTGGAAGLIKRKVSLFVHKENHKSQEVPKSTSLVQTPQPKPQPVKSRFESALKDRKNLHPHHRHHHEQKAPSHHHHHHHEQKPVSHKERSRRHDDRKTAAAVQSTKPHDSSHRICHQHSKHSFASLSDETDSGKWVVYGYV